MAKEFLRSNGKLPQRGLPKNSVVRITDNAQYDLKPQYHNMILQMKLLCNFCV